MTFWNWCKIEGHLGKKLIPRSLGFESGWTTRRSIRERTPFGQITPINLDVAYRSALFAYYEQITNAQELLKAR